MNKLPVIDSRGLLGKVDAWCAQVRAVERVAAELAADVRRVGGAR